MNSLGSWPPAAAPAFASAFAPDAFASAIAVCDLLLICCLPCVCGPAVVPAVSLGDTGDAVIAASSAICPSCNAI